ncbi:GNAT family N-acetyltransferase [Shewanella sp. 10N.286.52.B9]|uniref:GNAT family N-acetyltransferase n=1 Tax=Shewanella sp. 10N.286.52.B9 TaxID=1880837 RepID=UPI000C85BB5B|nr:GNAT family N-acetyltransferase [Shewanella sp. 10N.286.52.B9]PMG46530.1 GNAT family N-acetyltransferase [Shewanella sp. 10N.286.52.B9]
MSITHTIDLNIGFYDSVSVITKAEWQRIFSDKNPFTSFDYLNALEQSQCVSEQSGWLPKHIVVKQAGVIVAIAPCYEKSHSWGEYVFDWAWAEAYERNDLSYYPKLVLAVPFTPVSGERIGFDCCQSSLNKAEIIAAVSEFLNQTLGQGYYSSWHCLFLPKADYLNLAQDNISRLGTQFHWHNHNYQHFDDFLQQLVSRKRKNIIKERKALARHNLDFEFIDGDKATAAQWQGFIACYQQTYLKRSGHGGYLSAEFFYQIAKTMGASIKLLLVTKASDSTTHQQAQLIASALYFATDTHLYGRYWGCLQFIDGLHFETCYYQGIEYAIANGFMVFDAGAQGEHKVARGFVPIETYSNHNLTHQGFSNAIEDYCLQEQRHIKQYMQQLAESSPYK